MLSYRAMISSVWIWSVVVLTEYGSKVWPSLGQWWQQDDVLGLLLYMSEVPCKIYFQDLPSQIDFVKSFWGDDLVLVKCIHLTSVKTISRPNIHYVFWINQLLDWLSFMCYFVGVTLANVKWLICSHGRGGKKKEWMLLLLWTNKNNKWTTNF